MSYETAIIIRDVVKDIHRKRYLLPSIQREFIWSAVSVDPSESITKLNEKEHERNRFLFPFELERLIEASLKTRAKYYMPSIIYLGAEHGAAKQEILGLKWSKINFDFGEDGLITLFRTKNKCERTDNLMPRSKEALLKKIIRLG